MVLFIIRALSYRYKLYKGYKSTVHKVAAAKKLFKTIPRYVEYILMKPNDSFLSGNRKGRVINK